MRSWGPCECGGIFVSWTSLPIPQCQSCKRVMPPPERPVEMSDRLKPCPFCRDASIKVRPSGLGHSHYIECAGCDARSGLSPTVEGAVAEWNRVADTAAVSASAGAGNCEGEGHALAEHLAVAVQEYISACGRMHRPDMDVTFNALGPALKAYREAEAHVAAATGEAAVHTSTELRRRLAAWNEEQGQEVEYHRLARLLETLVREHEALVERNGR